MNYIWDMAIKAARQDIKPETITFVQGKDISPYMELSFEDINTVSLELEPTVEINAFYRFCDIFKKLLDKNFTGNEEMTAVLFDILVHHLLFIDCHQGLCKREYYGKFFLRDIKNGVFGEAIKEDIDLFNLDERHIILSGLVSLNRTGASVHLFKQVVSQVFRRGIIYYRSEDIPEVLIYLGTAKTPVTSRKIAALLALFLPLGFAYRLYWEIHFGIMGTLETMEIDNLVIY